MPKIPKSKGTKRPSPLKDTSGNAKKKPATTSSKAKAPTTNSSPTSQTKSKAPAPTKAGAKPTSKTAAKKSSSSSTDKQPNYLLLTRLRNSDDPTITRILSVPPTLTFNGLHQVMQISFGWTNMHMHGFRVNKIPPMSENSESDDESELVVDAGGAVMRIGTQQEDEVGGDSEYKQSDTVTLADVFENENFTDKVDIEYEYDFGDSWYHDIVLMGREVLAMRRSMHIPIELPIACLAGEGHPCAEDCGSSEGWEHLKEVFAKPRSSDPDDLKGWYKKTCLNGDKTGLNPYKWDIFDVNDGLLELAKDLGLS